MFPLIDFAAFCLQSNNPDPTINPVAGRRVGNLYQVLVRDKQLPDSEQRRGNTIEMGSQKKMAKHPSAGPCFSISPPSRIICYLWWLSQSTLSQNLFLFC